MATKKSKQLDQPDQHGTNARQTETYQEGDRHNEGVDIDPTSDDKHHNRSYGSAKNHTERDKNEKSVQGVGYYHKGVLWTVTTVLAFVVAWCTYASTRAYVSVEGRVTGDSVQLIFTNRGGTPANQMIMDVDIRCGEYPPRGRLTSTKLIYPDIPTTLAAGEKCEYIEQNVGASRLREGVVAIYVDGVLHYNDMFGISHTEPFYLIQGGPYPTDATDMGVYYPKN